MRGAQTIGSERAGETWSSVEMAGPGGTEVPRRAGVQLIRHMTKRKAVSLQIDRVFLGMGVWGERTFKFVLNVRVGVTAQWTDLNGHET